ncbi:rhodanese-like domain-containing protein [Pseudomonas sp. ISL-84]|nr:rhodanese-like domain-containing protein [Pseudomonas sp. ISL-84]
MVLVLIAGLAAGCSSDSGPDIENVNADKAKELWETEQAEVLDVRSEEEYAEGHIPGAALIPLPVLEENLDQLDKEKPYLVVCRSGNRSAQASQILAENGFEKIYNMENGMNEWTYEIEK